MKTALILAAGEILTIMILAILVAHTMPSPKTVMAATKQNQNAAGNSCAVTCVPGAAACDSGSIQSADPVVSPISYTRKNKSTGEIMDIPNDIQTKTPPDGAQAVKFNTTVLFAVVDAHNYNEVHEL